MGEAGPRKRILAVASGGGHWVQLNRMKPAFAGHDVTWVTTHAGYRKDVGDDGFRTVRDASRWDKFGLLLQAFGILRAVLAVRPHVVISTGAAPGYFAVRIGRLLGAKTVWIDSVANVEELSLSGQRAGKHANLWLTQWPHLARAGGPEFKGSVLP